MAVSKKTEFTQEDIWLTDVAKALSHPARIRILKILNDMSTCMVGSLVDKLPLAQATVSQHLKELKTIGVIKGCVEGTSVSYCINEKAWKRIRTELDSIFADDKLMKK